MPRGFFGTTLEVTIPSTAFVVSFVVTRLCLGRVLESTPDRLTRINVSGREVPAALGRALLPGLVAGALVTTAYVLFENSTATCPANSICLFDLRTQWGWLVLVPVLGMFLAGTWDDLRGDERPRGFKGHLGALRGGAMTGGVVKILAGVLVGAVTIVAWSLPAIPYPAQWVVGTAVVALSANLINLFDRAPGRANKIFLLAAVPLLVVSLEWRIVGAPVVGAAIGCLWADLREDAMLGDAGANPLGAALGLGLFLWTRQYSEQTSFNLLLAVAVALLALNLLSEKVSFSKVIENTPWLARLDHLGRK